MDNKESEKNYKNLLKAVCIFKQKKGFNIDFLYKLLEREATVISEDENSKLNGVCIWLTSGNKRTIAFELGWSKKSCLSRFNVEINKLINAEVLERVARGVYKTDPDLFNGHSWREIKENTSRVIFEVIGENAGTINFVK